MAKIEASSKTAKAKKTKESSKSTKSTTNKKSRSKTSKTSKKPQKPTIPETKVKLPELKDFLKAGSQFGHQVRKWNPKMEEFIFGAKNDIHIIDLSKTIPLLEAAGDAIAQAFLEGPVLFLGTKRQAADIVKEAAIECGAHFIVNRWAGGLLTNFDQIQKSIKELNSLERQFEEGIVGRTKFEISQMKTDWERLDRLYGGIKQLKQKPTAVFIIDTVFESGAVRECNYLDVPMISMIDTNANPYIVDYPIPANDDAIGSVKLITHYLRDRLSEVDSIYKIEHKFKDYSKMEVEMKKATLDKKEVEEVASVSTKGAKSAGSASKKASKTSVTIKSSKKTEKKKKSKSKTKDEAKKNVSKKKTETKKQTKSSKKASKKKSKSTKKESKAKSQKSGILGKYQEKKEEKAKKVIEKTIKKSEEAVTTKK
jgi:small subunit ribosomal protein S2